MTEISNEKNEPIVKALNQVLKLFDIEVDKVAVLLPQTSPEEIGQLLCNYKKNNRNLRVVYFDSLSNQLKDNKWELDTYRFWCGFFKKLGVGYEGSDLISLVGKPTVSKFYYGLFNSVRSCVVKSRDEDEMKSRDEDEMKRYKKYFENQKDGDPSYCKVVARLIGEKDFSFAKASHNSKSPDEKTNIILRLSYLITALRESILWEFKAEGSLKILIIDDRLYESDDEVNSKKIKPDILELLRVCKTLSSNKCKEPLIDVYALIKNNRTNFKTACNKFVEGKAMNGLIKKVTIDNDNDNELFLENYETNIDFFSFDYILVDLWYKDSESIRGLGLISELHHKFIEETRKNPLSFRTENASEEKLPEILAYSISDDSETIQMAHRMGAAGYVVKSIPESFVLAMVRAGAPLKLHDATRVDFLSSNNFPIIQRVPRQIVKNLLNTEISSPNIKGQISRNSHLDWLRKIPKSDLHVHFGTAIPLKWCYILSLISLIHWKDYWAKKNKLEKYKNKVDGIVGELKVIIEECLNDKYEMKFRRKFLLAFSKKFKISEVTSLRDVIAYLVQLSSGLLTDKQVACLINVMLGRIIFTSSDWSNMYVEAKANIACLQKEVELGKDTCIHNLIFFRDCRYIIETINLPDELEEYVLKKLEKIDDKNYHFDPLSEMLSTGMFPAEHPYGLERYLAALDLVGRKQYFAVFGYLASGINEHSCLVCC